MSKIDKEALKKSIKQKKKAAGKIIFKTCDNCTDIDCGCAESYEKKERL
ncbi:hypothetical protein [Aquimarina macrocephali]